MECIEEDHLFRVDAMQIWSVGRLASAALMSGPKLFWNPGSKKFQHGSALKLSYTQEIALTSLSR